MDPVQYAAWYQTHKGAWFSALEFKLITQSLQPMASASLLDVGCGTGHFTRRFANAGLKLVLILMPRCLLLQTNIPIT